jgi:hypothetical protein
LLVEEMSGCVALRPGISDRRFSFAGIRGGMAVVDDHGCPSGQVGKEPLMLNMRILTLGTLVLATLTMAAGTPDRACASPKYYFKVSNIHSQDNKIIPMAKELLEKEVAARPEFIMERGDGGDEAGLTELQKKGLTGVQVSMRIVSMKKDIKPPAPGKRDQQMSIDVKLSIFGHTIPGNKVLFTGDGDASLMGEFSERLREKEEARFTRTALESAIKQAVSTAVVRLNSPTLDSGSLGKGKKRKAK